MGVVVGRLEPFPRVTAFARAVLVGEQLGGDARGRVGLVTGGPVGGAERRGLLADGCGWVGTCCCRGAMAKRDGLVGGRTAWMLHRVRSRAFAGRVLHGGSWCASKAGKL